MANVPKGFITSIRVPSGPLEGRLALPCLCGYPTRLEDDGILHLIQWVDGRLMFCHQGCIPDHDEDDYYS
jgi:hypothetical protein